MNACSYDRVSTTRQAEAVDLETRYLEAIQAHCRRRGWELGPHFTDPGKSGKDAKRPGMQKAIRWALENKGVIVFYDLTRFSRSLLDLVNIAEQLKAGGAALSCATEAIDTSSDDPAGILTFHVLAACAEFQRRLIGAKVKHKNAETVKRLGYRTQGRTPYGWEVAEGRRRPVQSEQAVLARIHAYKRTVSNAAICEALNADSVPAPLGGVWHPEAVRRLRRRKRPAGEA